MLEAFLAGYRANGGKPVAVVLGAVLGIAARTVGQTVIVVATLRFMGVL